MRKCLGILLVLTLLLCHALGLAEEQFYNATGLSALSITMKAEDWDWRMGQRHTAEVTLRNEGETSLTEIALTLPAVQSGDRTLGTPVFYKAGVKKLKAKEQLPTYTISLEPGEEATLTVAWTPDMSLSSVFETDMAIGARTANPAGSRSANLHMSRLTSAPSVWALPLVGSFTMGHVLAGLAGLALVLFGAAAMVSLRRRSG